MINLSALIGKGQSEGLNIKVLNSDWPKSLSLYDTYIGYDRLLATFCGSYLNGKTIITDFERLIFVFESDGLTEKPGFYANVTHFNQIDIEM